MRSALSTGAGEDVQVEHFFGCTVLMSKWLVLRSVNGFRADELLNTLAQTAFRQQNGSVPTREQMLSLLSVAETCG